LPIIAAIGGMIVPASLFFIFNKHGVGSEGWGIPMATDIAFSLGILSLVGKRVPIALKVFLVAFAIVDDIGAILVIAFFYSSQLHLGLLLIAMALFAILFIFNLINIRHTSLPNYWMDNMVFIFKSRNSSNNSRCSYSIYNSFYKKNKIKTIHF
jgi:Na+/H+ antiporter NhaA